MLMLSQGAHGSSLAIVVDCDGTLVDTEQLWTIAERRVTEQLGGRWSIDLKSCLAGCSLLESAVELGRSTATPAARTNEIAAALRETYRSVLRREPVSAKPGAARLLADLVRRCIPVAVTSNSRADEVRTALGKAGLTDLVHSVHTPSRNARPKPAPDIYLRACRRLRTEPRNAIAIEDTQTGVDAAQDAGLTTIGIPSVPGQHLDADVLLDSLQEVDIGLLQTTVASAAAAGEDG